MKKQLHKLISIFLKKLRNASALDFVGVFLVVFLMGSAYFFLSRKVEYLDLTVRLLSYEGPEYSFGQNKPRSWYVEQVTTGKKQVDGLGRSLIEIVDVYQYPGPSIYHDVYVTVRLRALKNNVTGQYVFNGSPLLIHDIRSFKVGDLLLAGEIVDLGTKEKIFKKFLVTLELDAQGVSPDFQNNSNALIEGIENHVLRALKEGMNIADAKGSELVKIVSIKTQPGKRSFVEAGNYYSVVDPERTKTTLTLEILGEEINGNYYYRKESPLLVDSKLYLIFDNISVIGKISFVEPVVEN